MAIRIALFRTLIGAAGPFTLSVPANRRLFAVWYKSG